MDLIEAIMTSGTEFGRLVDNTRPDQLGDQTPCTEFTVRDLINHVTAGATMFAIAFEQGSVPDAELGALMGGDILGDDYKAAYATAMEKVGTAFSAPGALDGMVSLPFGEMPREAALGIAVFDVTVHGWDLAQATGQTLEISETDVAVALELGQLMGIDNFRDGQMFAAEVIVVEDAPAATRLAAYAGRQV